jgi:hypothetical protein
MRAENRWLSLRCVRSSPQTHSLFTFFYLAQSVGHLFVNFSPVANRKIELQAGPPSGHFSVRSADQPRIIGPHISRRIAALRPHFQPTAGRIYDVDPGSSADLRDDGRSG